MNLSWLAQLAPTIATAMGGPLAGMAVEAVGKALGVPPADAQKMLDNGKMTSDQLAQLKQAEIALQTQAQELGLDFEKLAVQDRASARSMQSETRSWIPGVMALVVTIGFFGILIGLMSGKVTAGSPNKRRAVGQKGQVLNRL
jgi:membrane-bound ClpP family serine protease